MTNSRRRRSGPFRKPDVPTMASRKVRNRTAFKWPKFGLPAFRLPAVRVDWMNAAIFAVLAVNVALIGFGIRQCAGGKAVPPRQAGTEKTAVRAQAPAGATESAARSAPGASGGSGAASVKSGGTAVTGGAGTKRPAAVPEKPKGPMQVEVLNGCGVPRIADRFTAYLRRKGYDVVRTDNYESFNVPATLVIDRRDDLPSARKLADALGVAKHEVISETHDMYMVDATVVLGKNFRTLAAWKAIVEKPIAP